MGILDTAFAQHHNTFMVASGSLRSPVDQCSRIFAGRCLLNELRVRFPSPTAQSKKNKQEDTFPRKSLVVKQTKNEKQKKDLNNKAISTCEEETIPSCEEETQSTVVKTGSVRASGALLGGSAWVCGSRCTPWLQNSECFAFTEFFWSSPTVS